LNINYIGDVGPIVDDIGSPIILQAMAATGGLMIVLGIMAAVWLWRHSDPFLAISCSVLMPLIGAGVLQAALG
jgi:UDP-N-acetylmuramyl pentapeptide phosphotransferase/UDP-N-acetylglucosamine-1-phosphate transferase